MTLSSTLRTNDLVGPYRIESLLGTGGMGAVYAAHHVNTGRPVALKTLHEAFLRPGEARLRFTRECRVLKRLAHPHVVRVLDIFEDGRAPYIVMERLGGEDLRGVLEREGRLEPDRAVRWLSELARGLDHAHRNGVVHRDLKPENIFVARASGGRIVPKVLDFGVSKLSGDVAMTRNATLMGTPHYMAPELVDGAGVATAASDQFSLGVILYEAVVGRRPFRHHSLYALLGAIARGEFQPPREVLPELPPELEAVILRAMAREPEARFADMMAFSSALQQLTSLSCGRREPARVGGSADRAPTLLARCCHRKP